jgi:threonyl-tRNA synthetase
MIKFSDLIGKTVKIVDVKKSDEDEDSASSQELVLEVDGVRYTLEAIGYNYGDDPQQDVFLCDNTEIRIKVLTLPE